MQITISKENYLKTIAEAESEGETVIAATLARWLNVSPPAVTKALSRLKKDNLVEVADDGQVKLTEEGRGIANGILNRHHLIERMLTEIFGMEWFKVHDEAERLEHAVSPDFEKLLTQKLGDGQACPHGNQTGMDTPELRRRRGWTTLAEAGGEQALTVVSVFERDRQLLEFLDGMSIHPGAAGGGGPQLRRHADAAGGGRAGAFGDGGGAEGVGGAGVSGTLVPVLPAGVLAPIVPAL
ncbi:MAG: metal-dependent transcriptional regulator [Bryobacterales bacterium]|nr:metal-dependent transcriptional regulator [Bryobacterales bacterium]